MQLAQGHRVAKWQSWGWNSQSLTPETVDYTPT